MTDSESNDPSADQTTPDTPGEERYGRRRALGGIAIGTGAVIAGAVGGAAASATGVVAGGWRRETVEFDVACLGDTWRTSPVEFAANDSDFRGVPFSVEGWIYPAGTIPVPGDGYVAGQDGSIGRWLCRGQLLVYADRPEPHTQTTQEFVFAPMSGDRLFPDDLITTSGLEGTFETDQVTRRSITGGTGRYMGATGEELQAGNGFNTTSFTDGTGNAPNFTMRLELLLPDV